MSEITSTKNEYVKFLRHLQSSRRFRDEQGLFLAEGEHMVLEALKEHALDALVISENVRERYASLCDAVRETTIVSERVFSFICDTKTPQGLLGVCKMPHHNICFDWKRVLALNEVQDPGNVGTLIRTADAAAFDGVILDQGTADIYNPKTLRATMGGIFHVPCMIVPTLESVLSQFIDRGFAVAAGDLRGTSEGFDMLKTGKTVLIVGNEGNGIKQTVLDMATHRIRLPMPGKAESLNAAVAGSILMYDLIR